MRNRAGRARGLSACAIACALACAVVGTAPAARAQAEGDLKVARELFQEAYKDEQEKRFADALEKFQRVARVKESAAVRYRIASVLDSLGRLRESRDAFRALAASKPQLPASEQDIADSAAERAHALDKRIPRLVLHLEPGWPEGSTRVMVDGGAVAVSTTPRAIEVDPGDHVVQTSAPGMPTLESRVTIAEAAEARVAIAPAQPPDAARPPPPLPPGADEPTRPHKTLGYVALGAGGVLVITSIVLLAAREGDVSDLERICPAGRCAAADRARVEGLRDEAELFGPLGVGLGVVGLAALGAGAYLLLRPTGAAPKTPGSAASSTFRVAPRVLREGAFVGFSGAF